MGLPARNIVSGVGSPRGLEGPSVVKSGAQVLDYSGQFDENWGGWARHQQTPCGNNIERMGIQPEQSPYQRDSVRWNTESSGSNERVAYENIDSPHDELASDRTVLLAKKHAQQLVMFSREDGARLEMLNQTLDLKYPRYTAKDLESLDEAEELLREIERIGGNRT